MMDYIEAPRAWGLTRGMARVIGLNLVGAVTDGWFSREGLGEMVDTCVHCDQSNRCTAYLAITTRADSLPAFCPNKSPLEALQS